MIRPLENQVLIKVVPLPVGNGTIVAPNRTISAEEETERNHHPEKPAPLMGQVVAFGPWPKLRCGLTKVPPCSPGSTVIFRKERGHEVTWGAGQKFHICEYDDLLAVVEKTPD